MATSQPNLWNNLNDEVKKPVAMEIAKTKSGIVNRKEARKVLNEVGKNHRGRGRTGAEKKAGYKKYYEYKKKAIELEKRNKQYLILWPASDFNVNGKQFYNMGGNSAIIYVHELAPRIKRRPTLRRDMDTCNDNEKFYSGVCSIQSLYKLESALKSININREPAKNGLVFFKLPREYTKDEIKGMLKYEQAKLDNLNKILYSKVLYPDIHRLILDLKKLIPSKVKNMEKTYREVIGMEMIKSLMILVRNYTQMAHGDKDELEAAIEMDRECDMILAEISIFNELQKWDMEVCISMGAKVVGIKQLLRGKIINKKEGETKDETNR